MLNVDSSYFVNQQTDCKLSRKNVRVYDRQHTVVFGNIVLQQTICIQMGTKCASLLAYWFLYLYEPELFQNFVKSWEKTVQKNPSLYIDI